MPKPLVMYSSSSGSYPAFSKQSRKSANAHSLSVLPSTPMNHLCPTLIAKARLTCRHPAMLPLCMNISELCEKGWQLESEREPSVVARTWAKIKEEAVLEASRARFLQFQAGIVLVKMHGSGPKVGRV